MKQNKTKDKDSHIFVWCYSKEGQWSSPVLIPWIVCCVNSLK